MNHQRVVAGLLTIAASALGSLVLLLEAHPACNDLTVSTDRFRLLVKDDAFTLDVTDPERKNRVRIPRDWLIPPAEEEAEADSYVSSFHYSPQVTAFPIGNGDVGLHISSFEAMESGSAQAAAGRDVFLIYAPQSQSVRPAGLSLGVTKERVRMMGCFQAKATHFLIADVNRDGLVDLGTVEEELKCQESEGVMSGPVYEQHAVRWFVFGSGNWSFDQRFTGRMPDAYADLPLIGTIMSPVDFAGFMTWRSYDPSRWAQRSGATAPYMPAYRRKLIAEDLMK